MLTDKKKNVEMMSIILAEAPEELRFLLAEVKMEQDKKANLKNLNSTSINSEMLTKTLAYLMSVDITDEKITRLLKNGKQEMIMRMLLNLMPMQCLTCLKDTLHLVGEVPMVKCRRCARGGCRDCYPEPVPGWSYLCGSCEEWMEKEIQLLEDCVSGKQIPTEGQEQPAAAAASIEVTQNLSQEVLEEEEESDDEAEEKIGLRVQRQNKRGDKNEDPMKKTCEIICNSFKFGGKCLHGMSGQKAYGLFEKCDRAHPEVCNKLLTHGTRGSQGCNGQECNKYHPRMCYSSMVDKVCTRERCTYWHCKGTTFARSYSSFFYT